MSIEDAKKIFFEENVLAVSPEVLQEAAKIILSELGKAEEKIFELERKIASGGIEDLPGEIWRDVDKRVGLYQVSNFGRIKSFCHKVPKILKQKMDTSGYYRINSHNENKESKSPLVHRLVAEAFIPNPKNLPVVNHKDGNKQNNCVENLEWVTYEENMYHAWKTGLIKKKNFPHGEDVSHAKLTNEQVRYIRKVFIKNDRNFGDAALARKFNVDPSTILRAASGQNYSCVD